MAAARKKRNKPAAKRRASGAKLAQLDAGWRTFIETSAGAAGAAAWPDPKGAPSLKKTIRTAVNRKAKRNTVKKRTTTKRVATKKSAKKKISKQRVKAR